MPQILVTISPQGQPTISTSGFTGSSCQSATAVLKAALGLKTHDQLTSEFYQSQTESENLKQQ